MNIKRKEGPFSRLAKAIREIRQQPLSPEAIEKYHRIIDKKEESAPSRREDRKPPRKIARSPEADI